MTITTLRHFSGWRIAGWGSAAALLALPAIAMTLGADVDWSAGDFLFAAIMLGLLGAMIEFAARQRVLSRKAGLALFGLASFFTVWSNAAVGIIGDEDSPVNPAFFLAVIGAVSLGAMLRFRARPMAVISAALSVLQFAIGIAATRLMPGHAVEWGLLAFFAALWVISAALLARPGQSQAN
ncbi:hypothetical protein ACXYN8_12135 [Altererythrobacter sp. CAU 1778]